MNFYKINFKIPNWVINDLKDRCEKHKNDFRNYTSKNKEEKTYKLIGTRNVLEKNGAISWLYEQFAVVPVTDCILYIPANTTTGIHKDESVERNTVITFPIFPSINLYAPTKFYNQKKELEEICIFDQFPIMLSTQSYHSVDNNDHDRYCFQLCFKENIEYLIEKYKNNLLIA